MAYDQIFTLTDENGATIKVACIALNRNKKIFLLLFFEQNIGTKKKYLRNMLILMGNQIITSTFSDTVVHMEELNLFDTGNDQNEYFKPDQKNGIKNLRFIKYAGDTGDKSIFIFKSEARAMYKIYNLSYSGYSIATMLENEFKLTPQLLTKILHHNKLLEKRSK